MRRFIFLIGVVAAHVLSVQADAQDTAKMATPAEIARLLRAEGHSGSALEILTQVRGPQPRQTLDELADTLAAIVISHAGEGIQDVRVRRAAGQALALAAVSRTGIPYSGAADRLMRIAENAHHTGERGGALWALTRIPDQNRAVEYLRQVAISQNSVAFAAVGYLGRETGARGLAVLRDLHRQNLVTERHAQRELASIARYHGWR